MEHRDEIILRKVLMEIQTAEHMMGKKAFHEFEADEMLKRAICMTAINIGELVKTSPKSVEGHIPLSHGKQ